MTNDMKAGGGKEGGESGQQQTSSVAEFAPLDVPNYPGHSVHISTTGVDISFLFSALRPAVSKDGSGVGLVPNVAICMSRGAAADFHAALGGILKKLTEDLGPVDTPFLKERREQPK